MPRKVIYIMSLAHSGSTLMELLINSRFRDVTSLGEVYSTYVWRGQPQKVCTCGKNKSQCPFWKQVDFRTRDFGEFYENVLGVSETSYVIDSSKSLKVFKRYHLRNRDRFFVVFLRKGLRPYYRSARRRARRESSLFTRAVRYNPVRVVLGWLFHNLRFQQFIHGENVAHITTTYEDLCKRTDFVLNKLSDMSEMRLKEKPGIDNAHLLRGNRMRHEFVCNPVVRPYEDVSNRNFLDGILERVDRGFSKYLAAHSQAFPH